MLTQNFSTRGRDGRVNKKQFFAKTAICLKEFSKFFGLILILRQNYITYQKIGLGQLDLWVFEQKYHRLCSEFEKNSPQKLQSEPHMKLMKLKVVQDIYIFIK